MKAGLTVTGLFGREVLRLARDRVAPARSIPRRVEDLDPVVLSRILGRPVTSVAPIEATAGTTDTARLALEGNGDGDDLPPSVFVKLAARSPVVRLFGNLVDLGGEEIGFYDHVRPQLTIEAPTALGLERDPATRRFVIVLDDLQARDVAFTDTRTPCPLDRAEAVLATLAVLHAAHWASPRLAATGPGGLAWLRANGADPLLPLVALAMRRFGRRLAGEDASFVPAGGRIILDRYAAVARELDAGPHTLLHGDPHPGNCYFVDGRAGLYDWQTVRRGSALRDMTYFLVLALDPEVRCRHERDLLDHYRERLAAAGGPALTADATWSGYRKMAAYPYAAAIFTAGLPGMQTRDIALAGLRRASVAVDDLDTAETLTAVT